MVVVFLENPMYIKWCKIDFVFTYEMETHEKRRVFTCKNIKRDHQKSHKYSKFCIVQDYPMCYTPSRCPGP